MSESTKPARRGGPTISDVARHAGVSTMTVSNVINGRTQRVSDATRVRVLAVLSELGYRVNLTARHLRTGRTGTIGLAVPVFSGPYYSELADRLADAFAEHRLRLVVERTSGRQSELELLSPNRLSSYDGFVLSVVAGDIADLQELSIDTPVVLIGERAVPARFDHVLMDNVGGARKATRLLLKKGARRVALLGGTVGDDISMPVLRTRGYVEAHRAAGVRIDSELVLQGGYRQADGYEHVRKLLKRRVKFDAIFAVTDTMAIGALRAVLDAGLRVPKDVQVIGFDNLAESEFCFPTLSTVEPGNQEMANAMCELLVSRINLDGEPHPARVVMPKATVIARNTTRA